MPAIETFERNQDALLWNRTGYNRDGSPALDDDPTELRVRWEWTKAEALDPQGNAIRIDAMAVVDREIAVGSEMRLGSLATFLASGEDQDIMQVATYEEVKDLKGRNTLREVGLVYKNSGESG